MMRNQSVLATLLLAACANDYYVGDHDSADSTSTSPSATASSTAAETTADTTATSTASTTMNASSDDSDTGTTAMDTSTGSDGASTGSNTDPDAVEAHGVPGGLDRVWIYASNPSLDRCVAIVLVWPMANGEPALTLPTDWALQEAWASPRASDCATPIGPPADAVFGSAPTGMVGWIGAGIPCELDVDVELGFAAQAPWLPGSLTVQAEGVMVMGC